VDAGCAVPPNMRSVAGGEIARITDRSRYLRYCALGGRPFDCADGASASGGEAYIISRSQWNGGFRAHSGPPRTDPRTRASRPTATYAAAICYVRFTSIRDVAPCLKCANSGRSVTAYRIGQLDPNRPMSMRRQT
jgi:hypothetical protein